MTGLNERTLIRDCKASIEDGYVPFVENSDFDKFFKLYGYDYGYIEEVDQEEFYHDYFIPNDMFKESKCYVIKGKNMSHFIDFVKLISL